MALSDAQKVDVRRHLGFDVFGDPDAGNQGYRFFHQYGQLEYRLNHLQEPEEKTLLGTGNPMAPANPNFTDPNTDIVYEGYLPICNFLEGAIGLSGDNFDIDKAGDYTASKTEFQKRIILYNYYKHQLSRFLGIPMQASKGIFAGMLTN